MIISAIPLKPPAGIIAMNPSIFLPYGKRLGCVDAEIVERGIWFSVSKFCVGKPVFRKLVGAVVEVEAIEDTEFEHFFRSKLWLEAGIKMLSHRLRKLVLISLLDAVADNDDFSHTLPSVAHRCGADAGRL